MGDLDKCYIKQIAGQFVVVMPDGSPIPMQTDIMVEQDISQADDSVASVTVRLLVEVKE